MEEFSTPQRFAATDTPPARVLLLGHRSLRQPCSSVIDRDTETFESACRQLVSTLEHFRASAGFGRGIAAPQIGIPVRLIALNLGTGPFLLCNPRVTLLSDRKFTMWDDCMSFPWLLVRLQRHRDITLQFEDHLGNTHVWTRPEPSTAELVQHEVDHLDGILALDRAQDAQSLLARDLYDENRAEYDGQVDYVIGG